jgi:PilZ domain-containing protein
LGNRRKHVRVPMRAQVICIADTHTLCGVTWNLSQKGIQVEVPALKRKAKLQLTFRLPLSGTIIDALGVAVWRQNGGMESGSRKSKTKASNPSVTSSGNDKCSGAGRPSRILANRDLSTQRRMLDIYRKTHPYASASP